MTMMATAGTGTGTDLTLRGETPRRTVHAPRSGREAGIPSAGVTVRSDDGSSSARDGTVADPAVPQPRVTPGEGSQAARTPGPATPALPQPRVPRLPPGPPPRPRIVDEPSILGLSRLTRGRFGARLFNLFFVLVFAVIVIQMISAILDNTW